MPDLKQHILSNAIVHIYTTFFYSTFSQQMWPLPEEILFVHFVTTLNSTFETNLAQENKGYESGSESFNIPTPLSRALRIYHVSTKVNLSFNPANFCQLPIAPEPHVKYSPRGYRCYISIHHRLIFSAQMKRAL